MLPKLPDFDTFLEKFANDYDETIPMTNLTFSVQRPHKRQTLVYFTDDNTIGIKQMLSLYDKMNEKEISHCILIYPGSLTFTAKKFIASKKEIHVETFSESELIVNVTKHEASPNFYVLNEAEKKILVKQFNGQYPKLLSTDPVAKHFGLKRDDIIQIDRISETNGIYTTYRIVV
jgi:DNA-directed RNA polymerase I, II, and III subunit RPABC1